MKLSAHERYSTMEPPRAGRPGLFARWGALVAVSLATLMMLVDFAAVSVALPAIRRGTHSSFSELEWALEALLVTLAAFVLTAGYIADHVGHRPIFLTGLVIFAGGSAIAGTAHGPGALIGGRVVQGVGGALIFATGSILLSEAFRDNVSRLALAVWGTVTGFAVAASPLVGGAVVHYLGWKWLFLLAVPLSLIALACGWAAPRGAPLAPDDRQAKPDWRAVGLFTGAIALLVIGLLRSTTNPAEAWTANGVLACFGCSALLLIALIAVEAVSPSPLLNISLFRQRTFTGSAIAALGMSFAVWGSLLFLVFYLSYDLGYSALAIGLRLLLLTAMTLPFVPLANALDRLVPVKLLICGGLVLVGGGLWWMSALNAGSKWSDLVPGLIVAGIGLELVNPRLSAAAAATVPPRSAGVASRTSSTFRLVGTATGVAVMGAIFAIRIKDVIYTSFQGVPQLSRQSASITLMVLNGQVHRALAVVPPTVQMDMLPIVHRAFASALHEVLLVAGGVALASALCALAVRSSDVPRGESAAEPAAPGALAPAPALVPAPTLVTTPDETAARVAEEEAAATLLVALGEPAAVGEAPEPHETPAAAGPATAPAETVEAAQAQPVEPERVAAEHVAVEPVEATEPEPVEVRGEPVEHPGVEPSPRVAGDETEGARLTEMLTSFLITVQTVAAEDEEAGGPEGSAPAPEAQEAAAPAEAGPGSAEAEAVAPSGQVEWEVTGPEVLIDLSTTHKGLHGHVTSVTGEPLAGAMVTVVGPEGDEMAHAVVGGDGSFEVTDVVEGTYTVVAVAPNYRPAASMVPMRNGEATTTLALLGVGAVSGHVVRAKDGAPLVVAVELEGAKGGLAAECQTGPDGRFLLADLIEGQYQLTVRGPGYSAQPIKLAVERGRTVHQEITLTGRGHLYGAVCGPAGEWLPGVEVSLMDASGELVATTVTDGAGSYHFDDVVEGWYTVEVSGHRSVTPVSVAAGSSVLADLTLGTGQA